MLVMAARYHRSGNKYCIPHALGSEIDVLEMFDQLSRRLIKTSLKPTKRISKKFNLMLETKVTAVEAKEDGIYVSI